MRRNYSLKKSNYKAQDIPLPQEFVMEKVNLDNLQVLSYKNADKILDWAAEYGDDVRFYKYGVGNYIRKGDVIVSWSLCDCFYKDQITIDIIVDERYRNQGLGISVVMTTVNECFDKGYKNINWSCVDSNKGSIRIAEKLGFEL